ncbi:MAG: protein kinase domain-containing protein, partial [Prochlorothrix sp.]
ANLVVRYRDGRIVLVDFGVVKLMDGLEQTRLALGGYRAPEQLNGQTFPQSDFFGLGATLLYLLTGEDPARLHRYQPQSAKYYREKIPGIALPMAEVLGHLLHPNPSDRYATVREVSQGLKIAQSAFPPKW